MPNYFKSFRYWWIDAIGCYVVACWIAPADPPSAVMTFVPIFGVWMIVRYAIIRRYRRSG